MNSHDTSLVGWVEKKKPGVTYQFDTAGSEQAYDRASVNGVGPFFTFQRADQGRERQGAGAGRAVPASAVGAADRGQRQHRRDGVADDARRHRSAAGGQAEHRQQRQRRSDGDRRRPRVHRRDQRSPLPRLRQQDRQGAVDGRARQERQRQSRCRIRAQTASSTSRSSQGMPCECSRCRSAEDSCEEVVPGPVRSRAGRREPCRANRVYVYQSRRRRDPRAEREVRDDARDVPGGGVRRTSSRRTASSTAASAATSRGATRSSRW